MRVSPPLHILILDQDDRARLELRRQLELHPNSLVQECTSVSAALILLGEHEYDILLLDDQTVHQTGIDLYQWMKENSRVVPTVELIPPGDRDAGPQALARGAYDYVQKDRIDENSLPILINSVHERHLLRLERDRTTREQTGVTGYRDMVESLQKATEAVSLSVNTSLTLVLSQCEEYERAFAVPQKLLELPKEGSLREGEAGRGVAEAFSKLRQELDALAANVRSLISLSNQLITRISESEAARQSTASTLRILSPSGEEKKEK